MIYTFLLVFSFLLILSFAKILHNLLEISKYKGYNYFDHMQNNDK